MKGIAPLCAGLTALPGVIAAETLTCVMDKECPAAVCVPDPVDVVFAIDPIQFVPVHHSGDPPRRQVTQVRMGDASFPAEPVMMSGGTIRGFWGEGLGGTAILMIVRPDLSAVLTDTRAGLRLTGTCEAS